MNIKVRKTIKKGLKWVGGIVSILLLLLFLLIILLNVPQVQSLVKDMGVNYLNKKLGTTVKVGHLAVDFPSSLTLDSLYLEDQSGDTLLYSGHLFVQIDMLRLLKGDVHVDSIRLSDFFATVNRTLPDTTFNFDYILKAFNAGEEEPEKEDTSSTSVFVGEVHLTDIRLRYNDVLTGYKGAVDIGDFTTLIDSMDLEQMRYKIDSVILTQSSVDFVRRPPLVAVQKKEETVSEKSNPSSMPELSLHGLLLKKIKLNYVDEVDKMDGKVWLDSLLLVPGMIDLNRDHIHLKKLVMDRSDLAFSMTSTPSQTEPASDASSEDTASSAPLRVSLDTLHLAQNHFKFDDNGVPRQLQGMDFNHLDISDFVLLASELWYAPDSSHVSLKDLAFREQSGFHLKQFSSDIVFTNHGAGLKDLLLRTDNSRLSKKLIISYPSLDEISSSPGELGLDIYIDSALIGLKDLYYFQPDLAKNEYLSGLSSHPIYVHGLLQGTLDQLAVDTFLLKVADQTSLALQGSLVNMLEPEKGHFDIDLGQFTTGKQDLQTLLPPDLLPEGIAIPQKLAVTGNYKGSLNTFTAGMHLKSTDGNANLKAVVNNLSDSVRARYDVALTLNGIRLGKILEDDTLYGPVSMDIGLKGKGLTTQSMQAQLKGRIKEAIFKKYRYKNLILTGEVADQKGRLSAEMNDPNLDFSLLAHADLQDSMPAVDVRLDLNNLNLQKLHLQDEQMALQGKIRADIDQLDLDHPDGTIIFEDWNFENDTQHIHIDSVWLTAHSTDSVRDIKLRSPLAKADVVGNYKLSEVSALFQHLQDQYLGTDSTADINGDSLSAWKMNVNFALLASPLWQQLLPEFEVFNGADIQGYLSSKPDSLLLNASVGAFKYGGMSVDSIGIRLYPQDQKLHYAFTGDEIQNSAIDIPHLYLKGHLDSNALMVNLKTKDSSKIERYHLAGKLSMHGTDYQFKLLRDSLLLNYDYWEVPAENYIHYSPEKLVVHHFRLQNGSQYLSVNSDSAAAGNPLEVDFNDFQIATLTQMAMKDSMSIGGTINGKAVVKNVLTDPLFTADLGLDSLAMNNMPIGSLSLKVDNEKQDTLDMQAQLKGNGNDLNTAGVYSMAGDGHFDFDIAINALSMATIEALSFGQIEEAKGKLTGSLKVRGTADVPQVNGGLYFKDADFKVAQLNNLFKLKNEHISFDSSGIHFDHFTLLDSAENKAVIDGAVYTKKYEHFKFDLNLTADDYRVLNVTEGKDQPYYGTIILSTDTKITGDETLPVIDSKVKLENKTDFTLAMIDENLQKVSSGGIVEFIDPDASPDTLKMSSDSTGFSSKLKGIDLSANIVVDTNALLHLVIDPLTGDQLSIRGKADLNLTMDPGGKMSLTGRYDVLDGKYNLSFEGLIKKEFHIVRGSYILWKGDPMQAEMDITARYDVEAPALDLVGDQLTDASEERRNKYKQELPFQVFLHLQGALMDPDIHFELGMPDDARNAFDGAVYTRIKQINTEPSEVNKQTLGLLVFGHFIQDNPFESASEGGAEQMVRQSVSKILSKQLNKLAGNLIQGVDLNFDLESSQDYSSGEAENQTNLNVGLSKSLFNDRTTVYVGGNIPLEGSNSQEASHIVGDVAVEYKLSKDGRYRLRAYRKNKYEGIIEGEFVETGLSFIIVMQYDKFKELFKSADE